MADEAINELRLTFETAMLKADNKQRECLLEHLDLGDQGQIKFEQFHLIRQSIEQNIGSVKPGAHWSFLLSRMSFVPANLAGNPSVR